MSYLASPLWLALIAVGLAVTAQVASVQFDYFGDELSLFPRWPRFDTERMIELFVFSMGVLLLPKFLGIVRALVNREMLRTVGVIRLLLGVPFEIVLSALYAPISMLMQSRQVWEILRGRDSGWSVQSRKRTALPWRLLWRRHWLHTTAGLAVSAGLAYVSPHLLLWMAPTLVGMALALPLSAASASVLMARLARLLGFLTIPEEVVPPRVMTRRDELESTLVRELENVTIERLLRDDAARQRHFSSVLPQPQAARGQPDMALLSARAKVGDARTVAEALAWLSPAERAAMLSEHDVFQKLVAIDRAEHPQPQAPVLRTA
jgi:membrane glycosyltransferase